MYAPTLCKLCSLQEGANTSRPQGALVVLLEELLGLLLEPQKRNKGQRSERQRARSTEDPKTEGFVRGFSCAGLGSKEPAGLEEQDPDF